MAMKRILKIILLGLAAVFVLLVVAVVWVVNDEDLLRSQLERRVSTLTGRELILEGLELDLGRHTTIRVAGIRLANPDWAQNENFLSVGSLEAALDLSHLLDGSLTVERLALETIRLDLEKRESGEVNWDLLPVGESGADEPLALDIQGQQLSVKDFRMTHLAPNREVPLDFKISDLTANKAPGGVNLKADGGIGGYSLTVEGFVGPLLALSTGSPMSHNLTLTLGEINLHSEGHVEDARTGAGARLNFRLAGPEVEWLLRQAALPEFTTGPFDARIEINAADDGSIHLGLNGDLGSFKASASGSIDRLRNPSRFDAGFAVSGPDLKALGETLGIHKLPERPYRVEGEVRSGQQTLEIARLDAEIGDDRLSAAGTLGRTPGLTGTALEISAAGQDLSIWGPALRFEGWVANPFQLEGRFFESGGMVAVSGTRLSLGDNWLEIDGTLGKPPTLVGLSVDLKLQVPDPGNVVRFKDMTHLSHDALQIAGSIRRDADAVRLDEIVVDVSEHQLKLDGMIALPPGSEADLVRPWSERQAGSRINARLITPSLRGLGETFNLPALPEQPLELSATGRLLEHGLEFEIGDANLGELNFEVSGRLPKPPGLEDATATFNLALPSLTLIKALRSFPDVPDLPVRLRGRANWIPDGFALADLSGTLGRGNFNFDGTIVQAPELKLHNARFSASGPEFREFFDRDYLSGLPGGFEISGEVVSGEIQEQIRNLKLRLGQAELTLSGTADQLPLPHSYDIAVQLEAPEVSEYQPWLERFAEFPIPELPLSVAVDLGGDRQHLNFTDLQASLGESTVRGRVSVGLEAEPEIRGELDSDRLDLAWLEAPGEEDETTDGAGPGTTGQTGTGGKSGPARIFSDDPLPVLSIPPMSVDVALRARELSLSLATLDDVDLGVKLTKDELKLDPVAATGAGGGRFAGAVTLRLLDGGIGADIHAEAEDLRMGLSATPDQELSSYPPSDFKLDVRATGSTMHEMAVSSDGDFGFIVGPGRIANSGIDLLFSDLLSELFSMLNPFAEKNPYTTLECGVARITFEAGKAHVDPMIFQTTELIVTSTGTVNLDTEKVDLGFSTRPKKGLGISTGVIINPFIKVGGSLANPAITLDAPAAAVSSGAAVATAGLTLLGKSLFDRYLRDQDPCSKVTAELRKSYETGPVEH